MAWADLETAIWSWVQAASGFAAPQVLWSNQQLSAPEGAFIRLQIGDVVALGACDEETQTTVQAWATGAVYAVGQQVISGATLWVCSVAGAGASIDAPSGQPTADGYTWTSQGASAGQEITIAELGRREFTLTVEAFGTQGQEAGNSSPRAVLSSVRRQLQLPAVRDGLRAAGLVPFDPGPVRDLSAVAGTIFEPRGRFDCRFYSSEEVSVQTGYIETVNATGQLVSPGDPLSPLAVDVAATSP